MKLLIHFTMILTSCFTNLTADEPYIQLCETPIVNFLAPIHLEHPHSGLEEIDCIYVINLDERPSRWLRTRRFFNERSCYPNRVRAVNGWAIDSSIRDQLRGPYSLSMSNGAVGCLLSHVSIFKDAYDRQFNTVWICEDDVEFCRDVKEISRLVSDLHKIDPDWDVLYTDNIKGGVGTQWTRPGQPNYRPVVMEVKKGDNILKIHGRFQTHSMIYSRRGIKKVLDYFTHVYLWSPIDVDIHYVPGIREYSVKKNVVTFVKENGYSDTETHNLPLKVQK